MENNLTVKQCIENLEYINHFYLCIKSDNKFTDKSQALKDIESFKMAIAAMQVINELEKTDDASVPNDWVPDSLSDYEIGLLHGKRYVLNSFKTNLVNQE